MTGNLSDGLLVFYRFNRHLRLKSVIVPFSAGHGKRLLSVFGVSDPYCRTDDDRFASEKSTLIYCLVFGGNYNLTTYRGL